MSNSRYDDDLWREVGLGTQWRHVRRAWIGPNAWLTAAAAMVPLFIVGVASLGSLAGRKQKGQFRLPKR